MFPKYLELLEANELRPRVERLEELLRRKGALAVELDNAHAIALVRRHAGITEPVKRTTPIYLTGEYRNSSDGDKRMLALSLNVAGSEAAKTDASNDVLQMACAYANREMKFSASANDLVYAREALAGNGENGAWDSIVRAYVEGSSRKT